MGSAALWSVFRKLRIVIFSLTALLSLGWAVFDVIYLHQEWNNWDNFQRGIVIALAAIDGISTLMFYLMMAVKFHLWLDATRVMVLLFLQIAAAVLFVLFTPNAHCLTFATGAMCRQTNLYILIGCLVYSALLLSYSFFLSIMAFVGPPPASLEKPDASDYEAFADSKSDNDSKGKVLDGKRGKNRRNTVPSFFPPEHIAYPSPGDPVSRSRSPSIVEPEPMEPQPMQPPNFYAGADRQGYTPTTVYPTRVPGNLSDRSLSVNESPVSTPSSAFNVPIARSVSGASSYSAYSTSSTEEGNGGRSPLTPPARVLIALSGRPPAFTPSVQSLTRPRYPMRTPYPFQQEAPTQRSDTYLTVPEPNGISYQTEASTPGALSVRYMTASVGLPSTPRSDYLGRSQMVDTCRSASSPQHLPGTPRVPSRPKTPVNLGLWRQNVLLAAADPR